MSDSFLVDTLKMKGNNFMKEQKFKEAAEAYGAAIGHDDTAPALYTNRALAYIRLNRFSDAISDCNAALRLQADMPRAYERLTSVYIALGDGAEAEKAIRQGGPSSSLKTAMTLQRLSERVFTLRNTLTGTLSRALADPMAMKNDASAIEAFNKDAEMLMNTCEYVRKISPSSVQVSVSLAAAYVINQAKVDMDIATVRGREREAAEQKYLKQARTVLLGVKSMVPQQQEHAGVLHAEMHSMVLFALGEFDLAKQVLQQYLMKAPGTAAIVGLFNVVKSFDQAKAKASATFKAAKYVQAAQEFEQAVQIITNAKAYPFLAVCSRLAASLCYNNRSFCFMKLSQYPAAVDSASVAVAMNPAWQKALVRRAMAAEKAGNHELCGHDYATLARLATNQREKQEYEMKHRHFEQKAAKDAQINPYELLGIDEKEWKNHTIPPVMLKKAYRKACIKWHPDKWNGKSEEERAHADKQIKDVNEAHDILKDPKRKEGYDFGGVDGGMGGGMGGMPPGFRNMGGMPPGFGNMRGGFPGGMFMSAGGMGGMGGVNMNDIFTQLFQ